MSATDPSDILVHDIFEARFKPAKNSDNHDITVAVDFDEEAGQFIAATINSAQARSFVVISRQDLTIDTTQNQQTRPLKKG